MDSENEKLRLASYLRVSTKKQEKEGTIDNQRMIINNYITYHDNLEIIEEFPDDGKSAFKDRPKFNEMISRLDEFDGVIITKLSRIGRSTKQLLQIMTDFKDKNKVFIVINDPIDTTTAQGKLWFTILAAFNEYEAALIKERMDEGLRRYIENGGKVGNKRKLLEDIVNGKSSTNKQLVEYYQNGLGLAKLAKLYKVSRNTIKTRLIELGVTIRKPKGVK